MDYQNNQFHQIKQLDYWGLVNMLMNQITPDTRAIILERLTNMNNQLLNKSNSQTNAVMNPSVSFGDLSRSSMLNSRKKDATEVQHPSMDQYNYRGPNPLPLNIPMNYNSMSSMSQMNVANPMTSSMNPIMNTTNSNQFMPQQNNYHHTPKEIDLDEIINDISNEDDDSLDNKLSKIKNLHTKIISDKRQRRKEKSQNSIKN
jgi:hypothetical protein